MLAHGLLGNTKNAGASTVAKRAKTGLKKWFDEEWIDLKTGKKCGRSGSEKNSRPYPSCRPKSVAKKMTAAEKTASKRKKTGPARVAHAVTASGRRRKG